MMKKISAIILTFIFCMSMVAMTVSAATFSQENISVTVNGYNVEIVVKTENNGLMSAHLYNELKDTTLGVDYIETPTENNGVYTYDFVFELDGSVDTQKLYICVGNNVPLTEKEFNYASINDKNTFFNGIAELNGSVAVAEYLSANKEYTSVDVNSFEALRSAQVITFVSNVIDGLDLATGYENLPSESDEYKAEKIEAVKEKETLFNEEFAKAMKCALVADAAENQWRSLAQNAIADGLFDDEYFVSTGTNTVLDVNSVYSYFGTEVTKMTTISDVELSKAFDRATLMTAKNELAYGSIKAVFMYFENKGSITVSDMTDINALISSGNDTELWKTVKDGTYADCAALINGIVSVASTLRNGGATGNGSSTDSDVTRPVSPGGFTGGSIGGGGNGGTTKPTTPTTPVDPKPVTPAGAFTDIDSVEWAKESIEALAEMGVLNGKGDGTFAPNDKVTREEFIKIIVAAFGLTDDEAECDFADVSADNWSYPYIAAAAKLGIVSGDGDNFNPTSGISRQDMAVIIYRVFEHLGAEVSGDSITFDDNAEIAGYAKDAVEALTATGIINGMGDGTFSPNGTVTRAQAAKVVYGLLYLVGGGK